MYVIISGMQGLPRIPLFLEVHSHGWDTLFHPKPVYPELSSQWSCRTQIPAIPLFPLSIGRTREPIGHKRLRGCQLHLMTRVAERPSDDAGVSLLRPLMSGVNMKLIHLLHLSTSLFRYQRTDGWESPRCLRRPFGTPKAPLLVQTVSEPGQRDVSASLNDSLPHV